MRLLSPRLEGLAAGSHTTRHESRARPAHACPRPRARARRRYILWEAEERGLLLPYACRMGCCTACAVRVLDGELYQPQARPAARAQPLCPLRAPFGPALTLWQFLSRPATLAAGCSCPAASLLMGSFMRRRDGPPACALRRRRSRPASSDGASAQCAPRLLCGAPLVC